jgi:hypothetical protein
MPPGDAGWSGSYGLPGRGVCRALPDGFDRVEGLAVRVEADGRAVAEPLAGAWLPALGRCEAGCGLEAAVVGW